MAGVDHRAEQRLAALRRRLTGPGDATDPATADGAAHLPGPAPSPEDDPATAAARPAAGPATEDPVARARLTARAAVAAAVIAVAVALGLSARGVLAADRAEPRLLDRPPAPTVSATATPRDAATGGGGPSPGGVAAPAPPAVTGGSGAAGPAGVVVHVVGRVRRPGLVRLPAGSRVADAVTAAGGVAPPARLDQLNLARPLADGEMLVVPGPGVAPVPAAAAGSAAGAGGAATAVAVDLNQATEAQFDTLPGVGPVTAGRILAWRAAHGRFSSVDELAEVPGIGPRTLERLRPLVRV